MIASALDVWGLDPERIWFFFPFASMVAPEPESQIGPVRLVRLDWLGWRFIERTELVDEHLPPHREIVTAVGLLDAGPAADAQDGWARYEAKACAARDAAATALRLSTNCPVFVEPALIGLYSKQGSISMRSPGPYRQAMLSGFFNPGSAPPVRQTLAEADRFYQPIRRLLTRRAPELHLPFSLFRRSFDPLLGTGHRLLFLFATLEGIFLPWTERVAGTTLEDRVGLACRLGGVEPEIDLSGRSLRRLRNSVAHGEPDPQRFADQVPLLQTLVRGALRAWLRFSDAPAQDKSAAGFNEWLVTPHGSSDGPT